MSINLNHSAWSSGLLIILVGFSSLWTARLKDVEAREMVQIQIRELINESTEKLNALPITEDNSILSISENTTVPAKEFPSLAALARMTNLVYFPDVEIATSTEQTADECKIAWEMEALITAYSSTVWETDDTPFITASGKAVRDGVVANNLLPFGTKIRIPSLYGNKIFTVEDRMHWSKSDYQVDIWFPETWQAVDFGVKRGSVEILEY